MKHCTGRRHGKRIDTIRITTSTSHDLVIFSIGKPNLIHYITCFRFDRSGDGCTTLCIGSSFSILSFRRIGYTVSAICRTSRICQAIVVGFGIICGIGLISGIS